MKQKITLFLLFILSLSLIIAFKEPEQTNQEIDYNNPKLDLNNPELNLNLINWQKRSQSEVPLNRINELNPEIIKVNEISNKKMITLNQWAYGSNLNQVEDLSLYSNAQNAVKTKHPDSDLNLELGQATYNDGILTNLNGPQIDLNNNEFKGTIINALQEGGFSIEKGNSQGKFTINKIKFDLSEDNSKIDLKPEGLIIISKNVEVTDHEGTIVIAKLDQTIVIIEEDKLAVDGSAIIKDKFGNHAIVGDNKKPGLFSLNYNSQGYTIEEASILIDEGILKKTPGVNIINGNFVVLDQEKLETISKSIMSSLDDKIETICPTMQSDQGCVKHAEDVSIDYLINEIGGIDKSDIKEIEEKTGITPEGLVALGVAGMVTTELLPSQINYEFEQGKFSSVIGLKDKKFNPYLLFNFDENILEINALSDASISSEITIPVKGIQTASFSVVVMPIDIKEDEKDETGIQNLKASFKLSDNSKLTVAYKFNENKETSVYYTKDIGPVSTSVGILGSEEFSSIMANLDLIKVFN